ncbi:MAG TPA: polyprenyl synthetase family protein [Candidatus Saccharimonadales bacterium]|nr:polyprenyl synthetase family protein [Candidatus Saccharimonadales bacterium]
MKSLDLAALLNVPDMPSCLAQVEHEIMRALDDKPGPLRVPLQRLLQVRGKRLRPALVIASARACGAAVNERVIGAAAAVELLHIASLVHDDIIDRAATRWNVPTISEREGVDAAILAGDFLFAKACARAAAVDGEVAALLAHAFAFLSAAEAQEAADQYNPERTRDSLDQVLHDKTARLLGAACQIGGICAGATKTQQRALARYGEAFGMVFQYADDVLDFLADPALLGKPIGTDVRDGVYTLPLLLGLESEHGARLRPLLTPAVNPADVTKILLQTDVFDRSIAAARTHAAHASKALVTFTPSAVRAALQEFPQAYLDWSLATLTGDPSKY